MVLDKRTTRFLAELTKICSDGSYKIVEKVEIAKTVGAKTGEESATFNHILQYLKDNELVDVKYIDEVECCLTVLPRGRIAVEAKSGEKLDISGKYVATIAAISFIASFFGALLGTFIALVCG
jgi:hypothetical protein